MNFQAFEHLLTQRKCCQLFCVEASSWNKREGIGAFYTRTLSSPWVMLWQCPITLGKNGLAWGYGLHHAPLFEGPMKKEGDGKSPAGLFSLSSSFGKIKFPDWVRMPYLFLTETIEAIDDVDSIYYNQIIDRLKISSIDWKSSEKMASIDLYDFGIVVEHNASPIVPQLGSAIFIHRWRSPGAPTGGCTGMDSHDLKKLLKVLDSALHPCLLQLPSYDLLRN